MSADSIIPGQSDKAGATNPQQLNRYSYVLNNPIRNTDPTGHDCSSGESAAESPALCAGGGGGSSIEEPLPECGTGCGYGVPHGEEKSGEDGYYGGSGSGWTEPPAFEAGYENPATEGAAESSVVANTGEVCSFTPDTVVATPQGEQPIGTISVGDQVLAYNPATSDTGTYTVTAVLVHSDPVIETLTINAETITTTPNHRFFTTDRGWVHASELRAGEMVRRADGGFGSVRGFRLVARSQLMYNLTVVQAHTFFVGDGQWLVHNDGYGNSTATPHANSHDSTELNHIYEITMTNNETGETSVYKYGISGGKLNADGTSRRATEQADGWNGVGNGYTYKARVLAYNIPGRRLAKALEQDLVDMYAESNPRGYYGPPGNAQPKPTPR